jgi:hypothetical protein
LRGDRLRPGKLYQEDSRPAQGEEQGHRPDRNGAD